MSCVEIASIIPATTWRLDALEVSLAVIFGVILGVILAIIISRCFVKELAKDRIHKHQDDTVVKNAAYEIEVAGYADMTYRKTKTSTVNEKSSRQRLIKQDDEDDDENDDRYRRKKRRDEESDDDDDDDDDGGDEEEQMKEMSPSGIIIALTMPSSERTLVELSLQDFQATKSMERELLQERESVFVHILQILLGRFVTAEKMDEKFAADFVERTSEELSEAKESLEATQLMVEQDLKNRSDLVKDPLALEEALENSRLDYIRKMDGLVQDAQIKVKDKLSREAGLTSEEVEAIMKKLLENMAAAERMIGQEQNRQATILHERLSKRQALSEQYAQVTARENKGNQTRVRSLDEVSKYLAEERELNESQAKSIMKQYQSDVEKIQEAHKAAVLKQSQDLAEKLQEHRERKLRALEKKQEEQREKLASKAPHVVNPADFVEAHHDLLEQQRNEKNDLIDELDYHEAEELSLLRKTLEEDRVNQFTEKDKSVFEELVEKAQLNEKEANRIVKKHQANVTAYEELLDQEKKRQNMILQEKIQLRKASWEEEQKRAAAEQQQLAEQQERTITKLIDTQSTLDEESKRQIMLQHEQNVTALNNHLQMTKLKQQKLLEAKLAKRRARYETLKAEHSRGRGDEEEESELTSKQAEELQAEEQAMREEQQAAILALRKQLAQETEEVLKDQDAKMGILIGKLQVGQARRQGVIKKLDKAVKDLQDQLVDSIANSNVVSERKTERIMVAHMQEIEEIEEKLRQARAHQEDQLQHKMETIKLMREKTLAEELKQEAKPVSDSRRESAAHKSSIGALQMMTKILESNRQKQALRQLEQEMKVETLKQKEELNEQLEDALEQELKERERDFLGQLAALSQLSKEELNNMVQTAIAEDGGDENDAKKLSKDLNKRIKTAKTRPDMDPNVQEEEPVEDKPKKKKKKKAKKAPPPEDL